MRDRYIYVPYELELRTEADEEYDKFKCEYNEEHEACPKCNALSHLSLLMIYPVDTDNKQDYKDLNLCICNECGDEHTANERVRHITDSD